MYFLKPVDFKGQLVYDKEDSEVFVSQ